MGKMKPGFKFYCVGVGVILLTCNLVDCLMETTGFGVLAIIAALNHGSTFVSAIPPPPLMFQKRLGAPMPELGRPVSLEDEDSEEDDEDILESGPRIEPHITPLNRDQCLAKLLCGMSVPVTGGNPKRNYYSEYANTVSKFFDAFPLDEEFQSKESIETYDDYSNEDDDKPTRMNSRRKPLNSSRVEATTPKLHLFDLALVDVAKPEENRTKNETIQKVPKRRNRMARARKIVENLGQKLQTVRQCQSIEGCPFTFKQLRQKLKQKEAQRLSSNLPLPSPAWSGGSKNKQGPMPGHFHSKPESRPRPLPATQKPKPLSAEPFSKPPRDPIFPHKDFNKGDDELEEIFGPPKVSKRPLGFHQGVDENFNYEYNPDRPWRPGSSGGNSYGHRPWKPRPKPLAGGSNNPNDDRVRPPSRPRPQNGFGGNQPKQPSRPVQRKPGVAPMKPVVVHQAPKRPNPPAPATTTQKPGAFPKKKISYLSSPYKKPSNSGEDDEGTEDINKVAPVELVGNSDAGEAEPSTRKTTTTEPPSEEVTQAPTSTKKKKKESDDSEEYDDDDYSDEVQNDESEEEYDEEYSNEEEEDENDGKIGSAKDKKKRRKKDQTKKDGVKKKNNQIEETVADVAVPSTSAPKKPIKDAYFDDENEGVDEIWTKLNFATTGANYKPLPKLKKKEIEKIAAVDENQTTAKTVSEEDSAEDDDYEDEEEDDGEEEGFNGSLTRLQKVRASSSSVSNEDEADDEVDDENQSKRKKHKPAKPTGNPIPEEKNRNTMTYSEQQPSSDIVSDKSSSKTKAKKSSKKKKRPVKLPSSDEEQNESGAVEAKRKNIMMEIGGRPLVPKPEQDQTNAHKTSNLITNRFKFQFINPYMGGPSAGATAPMDGPPGAYSAPLRTNFNGPTAQHPQQPGSSSALGSAASSLPFKFKLNPGALGNLAGGGNGFSMIPLGGLGGFGGSSASGSVEIPDPHHPPPPTPFPQHPHGPNTFSRDDNPQQKQPHFAPGGGMGGISGFGGGGGGSLFKLNPIPALTNFFKKPSQDSMHEGHNPPPVNAFIHRPIGPESSQYRRDRLSPASGSSNPAKKGSKGKEGKVKGKKGKV